MRRDGSHRLQILDGLIGVLLCGSVASLMALMFHRSGNVSLVPLWVLVVLLAVALRFGFLAGALGSLLAAAIFAELLFQPYGSLSIESLPARSNLAWMVLGGLVFSYLLGPGRISGKR